MALDDLLLQCFRDETLNRGRLLLWDRGFDHPTPDPITYDTDDDGVAFS